MVPQHQQDTCERQDLQIVPNSRFSDLSDSLNSMKVLLHLGKTPLSQNFSHFKELFPEIDFLSNIVHTWFFIMLFSTNLEENQNLIPLQGGTRI